MPILLNLKIFQLIIDINTQLFCIIMNICVKIIKIIPNDNITTMPPVVISDMSQEEGAIVNSTVDNLCISFDDITWACYEAVYHLLLEYIEAYYTPTWDNTSDTSYILTECSNVFRDFIEHTFNRLDIECDIEVDLPDTYVISDQVRKDMCEVILYELNFFMLPNYSNKVMVTYYSHAVAKENMMDFISLIARVNNSIKFVKIYEDECRGSTDL